MNVVFRRSFVHDLRALRERELLGRVQQAIELVEAASSLHDLPQLKKLSGHSGYYRIRIGDYRVGLYVEGMTVEFVRVLHRRDIYRYFP